MSPARLLCLITAILSLHASASADWPAWQHNNRRTGSTDDALPTKKLSLDWVWQSPAPPQTAWAGPAKYDAYAFHRNLPSMRNYDAVFHVIAVGDKIWFGSSSDDSVYCLNADDGKEQWVVTTDGPVRLAPTWSQGRLYFGSDDGHARCVNADNGQLIWKFTPANTDHLLLNNGRFIPHQPCRTGVVVDGETAWFACAMLPWTDSFLCAVDAETGTTTAKHHFVRTLPGLTMEGAPALSSKVLVLPQGRVAPRMFDRLTGEDKGEMVKSGGGSVVVVSLDDSVLHGPATDSRKGGFRQSSGQSREVIAGLGRGNALVVDGDTSWMLTDTEIVASSLTKRTVLWKAACDCPFTMIKAGDTLFVGGDQNVAAHSATTGKLLWQQPANGRVFGLAAANGRLFASSDTGAIHCYAQNGRMPHQADTAISKQQKPTAIANLTPTKHPALLGHWAFQKSAATKIGLQALHGKPLTLAKPARFSGVGEYQAIELDGAEQTLMVSPEFRTVQRPTTEFTATAWVRIDQKQEWGGIIGVIQDNGDDENGWLLGYRKNRFCVGVNAEGGPDKLTYLTADHNFELGQWYHIAGSYDGTTLQLFVNGKLCANSGEQSGKISYPDRAWFEIGAYHDKDEYFRMRGAIHEVQLYNTALPSTDIVAHYETSRSRIPAKTVEAKIASGPWLQFDDPQTATVRWTTADAQPTRLDYGTDGFSESVSTPALTTEHSAALTGLNRHGIYQYRIGVSQDNALQFTQPFECDNFFNYSPPLTNEPPDTIAPAARNLAKRILAQTSAQRSMCLIIGPVDADTLTQLCSDSELRFVVADTDSARISKLRQTLLKHGVYGSRATVHQVAQLSKLPFVGNWANLVVATEDVDEDSIKELRRHVRPNGGVAVVMQAESKSQRYVRPALAEAGDWSHLYGHPDNAAFAGEHLGGAKSADDLQVQWVGRPGPRYQADRSGRKPSPLSTNGRLFLQGLHRIVALDAFNGTVLWSLEIPELERFNMPRDCSNWCANDDVLFVAVKHECWKIDAASGDVVSRTVATDAPSEFPMEWGYVATDGDRLFGSSVRAGASWTDFWGDADAGWYDARAGSVTFPVCSDRLFCRDTATAELTWEYKRGVILNSTITVSGDTMYFVESRNETIMASEERRIGDKELWQNLHLVAIDAATGSPKWEKQLQPMSRQVVFYLAQAAEQLTLVSSADEAYRVSSFNDKDGSERWTQTTKWPGGKGDHGKAMMRPAIVGDRIFLRPDVLSLKDGSVLPEKMPDGHGCGTYSCTANAIIYRAQTVTMWNAETNVKSTWPRLRPDCWLSTIPANGMLLSPEGGGGCSCGSWMETSLGFMPKVFDQRSE